MDFISGVPDNPEPHLKGENSGPFHHSDGAPSMLAPSPRIASLQKAPELHLPLH
ncbi:Hypothetical protein FKW44_014042 [Caligus rogercresseyi]|uniref:Uncharacterized protein n=1 Tax=Caligus rogercresseyi TaxID=217165 RepID=A0A7T8K050_CALRO|nr:Hypothetical protein FKW44_014042 [Caligus rogercresseyi]